jgi:hypothetical protein
MREHYQQKAVAAEPKPSLEEIVIETQRYTPAEQEAIDLANEMEEVVEEVEKNIFDDSEVDLSWDYALEIKNRDGEVPYIIHVDEFKENAPDHQQTTYTYYEQDDILADVRDVPCDDMDALICLGNLGHWGHGSNDVSIVYVRNEELRLDIEVVRDRGSFEEQTRSNIKHSSDKPKRPKRGFDDD